MANCGCSTRDCLKNSWSLERVFLVAQKRQQAGFSPRFTGSCDPRGNPIRIFQTVSLGSSADKQLCPGAIIRKEIFPPGLSFGLLCSC
jgi:hypothetical protein